MGMFIKKPVPVDCMQYTENNLTDICIFIANSLRIKIGGIKKGHPYLHIRTSSGWASIYLTCWIVKETDGTFSCFTHKLFMSKYDRYLKGVNSKK